MSGIAIGLEEIEKQRALRIGTPVGDEPFAHERSLLRRAATVERDQPVVDPVEIHALCIPAGVEFAGLLFRGAEAGVEIGARTACRLQRARRFGHPGQPLASPRRLAEAVKHVLPAGRVFASGEIASDGNEVRTLNTASTLCCSGCMRCPDAGRLQNRLVSVSTSFSRFIWKRVRKLLPSSTKGICIGTIVASTL